ncbi:uncharacterized protein GGQ74_001688 [Desulfobaculum xiamenense]|uniref:Asparagine synthetase domain-containing protein n=1 Tax=Desulfobaculum xiamenense TaxID=995050 RepID=A0A846QRK2_9BACT|nr:ATP-dependent sacrificial sulfur transferase LarE [Desulfobaculum xiamenense]NJB68015.1 uncharacterized protein [Desulfobaculum xiamenense]
MSGGLDSRLLSLIAARIGMDAICVHFTGPHLTPDESASARQWLETIGLPFVILETDPLAIPEVAAGSPERCYHCKRHLFATAARLHPGRTLIDGTNASDLTTHRPGLKALRELGITSPFAACAITKDDIHTIARAMNLPNPDQPARPCLLTRFPYNISPGRDTLRRLAAIEDSLARDGWTDFRVRIREDGTPQLHANPINAHRTAPSGLDIVWTTQVSGLWDRRQS